MTDDKHALVGKMQTDRIKNAAKAQDHVAPALPCKGPKEEFAHQLASGGQFRMALLDAQLGQTVQNPELSLSRNRSSTMI